MVGTARTGAKEISAARKMLYFVWISNSSLIVGNIGNSCKVPITPAWRQSKFTISLLDLLDKLCYTIIVGEGQKKPTGQTGPSG